MNYEKLHKDTINKLQQMVNSGKITVETARGICADFVPEREDEVMIKFIKNQLFNIKKTITENYELDAKLTKAIDWLEKQGNLMKALQISNANIGELVEKNYYLKEQLEKQGKNNMGISEATKQKLEDNLNKALEKETPESCNEFLDEQGKKKPVINMKTPEESLGIDSDTYSKIVDECVYGEQKPTDKVEPKFKVGDFIANDYCVGKVIALTDDAYLLGTGQGIPFSCEHNAHLWSIQDAKDGDVLYENDTETIFIFESQTCGWIKVYCDYWVSKDKFTGTDKADYGRLSEMKLTPATKEQRDTLMKAMADAGYEWDAENKQLKKIESRQEELTEFEKAVKQVMEEAIECGDTHNLKADADMLLRLVQKPTWGEEDKKKVNNLYILLDQMVSFNMLSNKDATEFKDWLKSLIPQSQWKPSDEQIYALNYVVNLMASSERPTENDLYYNILKSLREQLKKLK